MISQLGSYALRRIHPPKMAATKDPVVALERNKTRTEKNRKENDLDIKGKFSLPFSFELSYYLNF